ncbi:MAG: peptide ligase PGM1-related protein, partial [Brasilonema sp.]
EYVKGAICSPSSQGFIDASGGVKVLSSHDQILVGSQYIGCVFPAPVQYISQMNESVKKVGKQLHLHGVHGTFGIDFIGFENGKLLATEINLRKVGPTHAFSYVESVIGNTIDSDGFLRNKKGQPIYYVHRRFYEPSILKYLEPKTAVEALRSYDLLYKHSTQTGTILHILSALKPCGYVEITSIDNNRDKAFELDKQAQKALLAKAKLLMRE